MQIYDFAFSFNASVVCCRIRSTECQHSTARAIACAGRPPVPKPFPPGGRPSQSPRRRRTLPHPRPPSPTTLTPPPIIPRPRPRSPAPLLRSVATSTLLSDPDSLCVRVCACVRACVCARVRACVRVSLCVCVPRAPSASRVHVLPHPFPGGVGPAWQPGGPANGTAGDHAAMYGHPDHHHLCYRTGGSVAAAAGAWSHDGQVAPHSHAITEKSYSLLVCFTNNGQTIPHAPCTSCGMHHSFWRPVDSRNRPQNLAQKG